MKDCEQDILRVATILAAEGGLENVRQREVAARAGVALGTLYKRYPSKEDLLVAVMTSRMRVLDERLRASRSTGGTPVNRLIKLFAAATADLVRRPQFTRALLRVMASGVPEVAGRVAAEQASMGALVIASLRGDATRSSTSTPPTQAELTLSRMLMQLWFAGLVGWSAGVFDRPTVDAHMTKAVRLLVPALGLGSARRPGQVRRRRSPANGSRRAAGRVTAAGAA